MGINNGNIIEILTSENSLINTSIKNICIASNDDNLVIEITFTNFSKKSDFETIKMIFSEIIEYSFYYNNDYIFYNIETFKFLKIGSGFYLSLDPDEEIEGLSDNDMDFVRCNKIELQSLDG